MKFTINIEYGGFNNKSRVILFESEYDYFNRGKKVMCRFNVNTIILTTKDFDLDSGGIQITTDTCSVQYRPKALYTNSKGVYYKENSKPKYLTCDEIKELNEFVKMCEEKREDIINKNLVRI